MKGQCVDFWKNIKFLSSFNKKASKLFNEWRKVRMKNKKFPIEHGLIK